MACLRASDVGYESKRYKIVRFRVKGTQWFFASKSLEGPDEMRKLVETSVPGQMLCAIVTLESNSTPFYDKRLFPLLYRLVTDHFKMHHL